jgi:hypothetical protein
MGLRIGVLVPGARFTADDGKRIGRGVVRHPQPDDAGFQVLGTPRRLDLREKALGDRAARPNVHGRQAVLSAPGLQRRAHAADRARRVFSSHDRFVEDALHAAFRSELGDAERVLLSLVRVAVNVDGVLDADHVIERGIDRLFVAAPGGVRCHRSDAAGRGVVWIGLDHIQSSDYRFDRTITRPRTAGNRFSVSRKTVPIVPALSARISGNGSSRSKRFSRFYRRHWLMSIASAAPANAKAKLQSPFMVPFDEFGSSRRGLWHTPVLDALDSPVWWVKS